MTFRRFLVSVGMIVVAVCGLCSQKGFGRNDVSRVSEISNVKHSEIVRYTFPSLPRIAPRPTPPWPREGIMVATVSGVRAERFSALSMSSQA